MPRLRAVRMEANVKSTQEHIRSRTRMVARPVAVRAGSSFSLRDGLMLVAGMAAVAGLLTSCSSGKGQGRDSGSDAMISTGLDALADPGAKQPKLNRKAEIKRDAGEDDAYAKLADQATLDLNALLEARGKKKEAGGGGHTDSATGLSARRGASSEDGSAASGERATPAQRSETQEERPAGDRAADASDATRVNSGLNGALEAAAPSGADASWADDPKRTIPMGERPKPATRFAKDANPANATADVTREAMKPSEKGAAPTSMTVEAPPQAAPEVPVFKGVNAALCTRVTGFGKLEAMPLRKGRNAFVFPAARVNRAIVYVELENFGYRPARSTDPDYAAGDAWAVELSTEIQLLDDPDSILQFKERERTVIETGRNKRRDFYLVQEIELPPTLTVGAYNLKLILRDKSGAEPVRSEVILPVQIVADVTAFVEER